jgi:hypothetical protein
VGVRAVGILANSMASNSSGTWPPTTEEGLRAAAREGNLKETHSVELKRELPSGDGANKELAADLASLAIDGGLLFIGIDESTGPGLSPIPLQGLAERIEQVALSRIDEPLHVTTLPITCANDPATGYLVVRVPASPRAPHMAGHRYWGRGDKTKFQLSDGEVERLMLQRERWAATANDLLRDWITNDPLATKTHTNGHLFVVASPVPQREGMLLPLFGDEWQRVMQRLVSQTSHSAGQFVPDLPSALYNFSRTPEGWSGYSYAVYGERREGDAPKDREDSAMFLEVCEDGGLRLWCGRATFVVNERLFLLDSLVLGLTGRMISLAHLVGSAIGFLGSWDFGVGVTGLENARLFVRHGFNMGPVYTQPSYTATTRASTVEIEAGAGPILKRLLRRLMRAVGGDRLDDISAQFAPPTP